MSNNEIHMHQNMESDLDCPVTRRECTIYRKSATKRIDSHESMIQKLFEKIDMVESKVDQGFESQRSISYKEIAFLVFIAISVLSGRYIDVFGGLP